MGRTGVTGVMAAIFVMAVAAMVITTVKGVIIGITGAKGPLPTARMATDPQAAASQTVRPAPRMKTVSSAMTAHGGMTAMARAGGLRVRRVMTGHAATTGKTVQTGPIALTDRTVVVGRIVMTVRNAMAVRTGRTETTVAARTVTEGVPPTGTETVGVKAARADAPARAAASLNRLGTLWKRL